MKSDYYIYKKVIDDLGYKYKKTNRTFTFPSGLVLHLRNKSVDIRTPLMKSNEHITIKAPALFHRYLQDIDTTREYQNG